MKYDVTTIVGHAETTEKGGGNIKYLQSGTSNRLSICVVLRCTKMRKSGLKKR